MAKNTKALTKDELEFLDSKYKFELIDKYIIVSCSGFDRKVLHEIDKPFSLNTSIKKLTITKEAIDFWIYKFKDNYSLIDVQNAINSLIVTYQDITLPEIELVLHRQNLLVKTI